MVDTVLCNHYWFWRPDTSATARTSIHCTSAATPQAVTVLSR